MSWVRIPLSTPSSGGFLTEKISAFSIEYQAFMKIAQHPTNNLQEQTKLTSTIFIPIVE